MPVSKNDSAKHAPVAKGKARTPGLDGSVVAKVRVAKEVGQANVTKDKQDKRDRSSEAADPLIEGTVECPQPEVQYKTTTKKDAEVVSTTQGGEASFGLDTPEVMVNGALGQARAYGGGPLPVAEL
jgi:hypothetical protein